jgi:hypothetical protein
VFDPVLCEEGIADRREHFLLALKVLAGALKQVIYRPVELLHDVRRNAIAANRIFRKTTDFHGKALNLPMLFVQYFQAAAGYLLWQPLRIDAYSNILPTSYCCAGSTSCTLTVLSVTNKAGQTAI